MQLLLPTISRIGVEIVRLFETPVRAMLYAPVATEVAADRVTTLEAVAGLVPNEAVTPAGNPDAERVTTPANPPTPVIDTVSTVLPP